MFQSMDNLKNLKRNLDRRQGYGHGLTQSLDELAGARLRVHKRRHLLHRQHQDQDQDQEHEQQTRKRHHTIESVQSGTDTAGTGTVTSTDGRGDTDTLETATVVEIATYSGRESPQSETDDGSGAESDRANQPTTQSEKLGALDRDVGGMGSRKSGSQGHTEKANEYADGISLDDVSQVRIQYTASVQKIFDSVDPVWVRTMPPTKSA